MSRATQRDAAFCEEGLETGSRLRHWNPVATPWLVFTDPPVCPVTVIFSGSKLEAAEALPTNLGSENFQPSAKPELHHHDHKNPPMNVVFSHIKRFIKYHVMKWACCSVGGRGSMLQDGRLQVLFPMTSLDFSTDLILPAAIWPRGRLSL
jgi:hypothetical protein